MLPASDVVLLSRFQFGMTALYHFLFVPLTLGLSTMLGIMETVYFMTNRPIWRTMTQYWGLLFGINVAMGVATGVTLEFQFGTNWAYYSHYVGDVFGAPLAIEGLMAFFLEATFIGIFFFGWDRISKGAHLIVTWMMAAGASFSALWILIANAWMQDPVGAHFNFRTMRMELYDFYSVIFSEVAQAKFVHTISAGYVTGAMFVLSISAYFLLRGRNVALAKRSMTIAAAFGLASALCVVVLGDESGYLAGLNQKMKVAAIEGMWDTEPAPAPLTVVGIPDQKERITKYTLKIPYLLGLIATRSISQPVYGIFDLVEEARDRIRSGILAYHALDTLRIDPADRRAEDILAANEQNIGYGFLLKRFTDDVIRATPEQIEQAAWYTVPDVFTLFWTFRVMVACGLYFILLFAVAFYLAVRRRIANHKWFLWIALLSLPLPWLAAEMGWVVAEYGRQPWVVDGLLPTFMGASSLTAGDVWLSLAGFILFYSALAVVELYLMVKYIRLGPENIFKPEDFSVHPKQTEPSAKNLIKAER
ncbi:cytochrome ubiquinol oxidase subunit I [Aquicella lusitana]|uniref:Cytochrome bd-I ubiquinol oxidase subunit 1 apoprotein n=1 Tax=Aquicella lusitana TaxID=254246 RepID=A0A370GFX2_9COXI|nr:cytochrome ubiquinol oxidase subunit I [Aquicella lusitana]RDI42708.1 cytochrome bd-I ubiquinol oxidase subunit 1 apoprotein [Aquicella lusitana]VVC73437.1 Cytochrome bd ubiquinol oxidase subunit 1 [Aquicella lusitana]